MLGTRGGIAPKRSLLLPKFTTTTVQGCRVCSGLGSCDMYHYGYSVGSLHAHLDQNSVEYIQFAFRWMNNLLMREFPLRCVIRLWDSYLVSVN